MPATNGKPSIGRFELPQLTPINYSLTDGTGIPPPPDSPVEESVPASVAKDAGAAASEDSATKTNGSQSATPTNNNGNGAAYDGRGRPNTIDEPPMSPASSTRQGSIRRFLSRKSLNTNYTNGTNTNASQEDLAGGAVRPESAMSFASQRPSLAKKKSGSWFRRLGSSNGSKRTSIIYEDKKPAPAPPVKKGPPPPKLPELNQLKAKIGDNDEGSLGGEDMFKNIK
ncbi:hypothetical protein ONS95_004260 [Cadophora gregata]|uniref:uncharacterized protein n=1 Tax=Cadophora gregata TaxID=51156 RepID=UPI0026DB1D29|nr:uncharacterized protein ONS95_004260 [Cadophora gregata]KAK0105364.1 hypothetical protein ONS96_004756 [Cadophora gregata f. sp. sojae]KAK0105739.1 hypothetical protein ONS95_004260 [Cadophora gregata]